MNFEEKRCVTLLYTHTSIDAYKQVHGQGTKKVREIIISLSFAHFNDKSQELKLQNDP